MWGLPVFTRSIVDDWPSTLAHARQVRPSYRVRPSSRHHGWHHTSARLQNMKVILWIVAIIFLIGLAVVLGLGGLIF